MHGARAAGAVIVETMSTTSTTPTTGTDTIAFHHPGPIRRLATALVLGAGPIVTADLLLAHRHSPQLAQPGLLGAALLVLVVVAWCPALLFSVPALVLGDARDVTLPWSVRGLHGLARSIVRGVILVPYMVCSRHSVARLESAASVLGWVAGLAVVLPYLHPATLGL